MKYLLDTCVISELAKKSANPKVIEWIAACNEDLLFLSVLTIGEIQKGISKIKETGRWRAKIATQKNRYTHLGVFSDFFEAVCCRKSAENKHGYHKNHGKTLIRLEAI